MGSNPTPSAVGHKQWQNRLERAYTFAVLLLIDNYDSFSWNLVHYLKELGAEVEVSRNDKITVERALDGRYGAIVISPGPCTPNESGVCLRLIAANGEAAKPIPTLGVCLGHQAIGQAFGGKVVRAPKPSHGKTGSITHRSHPLFAGLSDPFTATRYHSLILERATLPSCFEVLATLEGSDMIMALSHKTLPLYGVQFHPESIATESGHDLLGNFLKLAAHA